MAFIKLLSTYNVTNEKKNSKTISGFEVARKIMDKNKLEDLYIVEKRGSFTDTYNQNQKVVKLSTSVFNDENLYSLAMSSYIASYAVLSNKEDKTINLKLSLDQFFKLLTYFFYIVFLFGICLNLEGIQKVAFLILLIIIIYRAIGMFIDKKTIYLAYDELKELDLFTQEEEKEIVNILKTIKFYNLSSIILCLQDGISAIKEIIDNSKR
jgi:Zn-dependent membrane protease YugP